MKPVGHFVSSALGAAAVFWFLGNALSAAIFFISSTLIDADHLIDYIREYGLKCFNFRVFCQSCYEFRLQKTWLVFHSFELLFVLWAFISVLKLNMYWISFALGVTFHYMLDCLFNPIFAWSYFFIFRWRNHFYMEKIFRKEIVEKI